MSKKFIQSVGRAGAILDYLGNHPNSKLQDISEALELNKSTLHSILSTLEQLEYVRKNKNFPRYSLGVKLYQLGKTYEKEFQIRSDIRPLLEKLSEVSNESVFFTLKAGKNYIYIAKQEPDLNIKISVRLGTEESLYSNTAIAKVYLAAKNDEALDYAYDLEEIEAGLNCIAFPVMKNDHMFGVIGIGGPSTRFTEKVMEKVKKEWDKIISENEMDNYF